MVGPMAYQGEHILMQFHGKIRTDEEWSCGIRSSSIATAPVADYLNSIAGTAQAAWTTFMTTCAGEFSPSVSFTGVSVRRILPSGRSSELAEKSPATPTVGAGSAGMPNQIATCLTLLSQTPGRSGKGRIYLPLLGATLTAGTGRIVTATVTKIAGASVVLLNTLNNVLTAQSGTVVAIQSQAAVNGGSHPVRSIRVGDVFDTQRRRRDSLAEVYVGGALI